MDTSKAIAHGVANPKTDIWDFWSKKARYQNEAGSARC